MICSSCGHSEESRRDTCSACGILLSIPCPSCFATNPPVANYCNICSHPLRKLERGEPQPGRRGLAEPAYDVRLKSERKVVTVLFSDIVDSTSFIDGLDPEDADARLAPTLNSMLAAVHLYGGTVSSMRGDGLSALFGAPLAFEDHAARACLSGIAMLDGVRSAGQGLKIRIGIHSGEVLVRSVVADFTQVYEATGPTVHIAARMEQLASPDTVRITRATRDLSRGLVREHLLGLIPVRGISESIEQYEFTSAAPTRTRWDIRAQSRLTAFVGRRSELLVLSKAWHDACRKRGRAITLVGDPGVGKSRILHEFIVSNESVSRSVHVAASASYETHSTFLALSRIVRGWLGIEDGATSATIVQCITSSCNSASTDDIRALHSMLDRSWSDEAWEALEPETRRRMMIQAAARFIQFAAERSPVVIVFEDLHWMDAGTIEFVRYLASDLEGRAILLLCTTRPETTVEKLGLLLEEMPIDTLSREEAISLLDQLLGKSADLQKFKLGLIVKSAGTPLFLEEVVQSLIERAVLVKTGDGYRLMSSLKELSVPATVQAVIAARIDNLPDQPLALLQKAAIIGAEGPRHLLLSIAALGHSEFDQRLAVLEARGFLRLLGDNFAFKHVLTREVVYDSILSETRQAAHLDVVRSIEEQSSKFGNENAEALARHSLAGLDWPRAAKYFRIAAERASEFSAFHESAAHLRIVLMSLEKLGTSNKVLVETIDTLLSLRRALFAAGDLSPILGHLTKAAELAEQIGDEARLAAANIFISNLYSHRGRLDEAIETGSRALAIAQRLGDFNLQISASIVLSLAYEFGGRSREVVASLEPIAATVDADMDHPHFATSASFSVQCIAILAGAFASLGRFEDADQYAKRAVELARKRGRPYDVGLATYYLALVQLRRARIDETIAIVQGGIRDAVGFVIPWLHSALGYAYLVKGDAAEARALLEDVHERCRLMGLDFLTVRTTAWLAFANLRLGDTATAERLSASALARASAHSYRELEAWLLRLRATLRFNQTPQDHADAVTMVESALGITAELGLELERTHCIRVLAEITDGLTAMPIANDAYVQMGIAMSDAEPALMLQFARQHRI